MLNVQQLTFSCLGSATLLLMIFSGCTGSQAEPQTQVKDMVTITFSTDHQPPAFLTDERIARIKAASAEFQQIFKDQAAEKKIPGLVYGVVVDDSLVLSGAVGVLELEQDRPATVHSAFRIASMSKSFTAMAILKLRDEGKLSLEDPVSRYIPEMADLTYLTEDAPAIDIENLLTMTAGFPEDNPWGDRQLAVPPAGLIDLVRQGLSFSNVPGYEYEYSNTGFALLGHIVSVVSGMPFQEYIRQEIFLPLGMEHTYWEYDQVPEELFAVGYRWEDEQWKEEPLLHDGAFGAMGGLITSIADFSRYVSAHLAAWPPRNGPETAPLRRSSLREMQTPQFSRLNPNSKDAKGKDCPSMSGYGFGLGISRDCNGRVGVGHGGALPGYGSNYQFYPEYGVGVMAFGNLTYTSPFPRAKLEALLFDQLGLEPRRLPVSATLAKRKEQVLDLIQNWDPALEAEILAENFYLDQSRESRMLEIRQILEQAGTIKGVDELIPSNQLRGRFDIEAEKDKIRVFFTLTPEKDPKVQRLDVWKLKEEDL